MLQGVVDPPGQTVTHPDPGFQNPTGHGEVAVRAQEVLVVERISHAVPQAIRVEEAGSVRSLMIETGEHD